MLQVCGDELYTGSHDKTVRVWNIDTGETLIVIDRYSHPVRCLKVWEDMLFTGHISSAEPSIQVLDVADVFANAGAAAQEMAGRRASQSLAAAARGNGAKASATLSVDISLKANERSGSFTSDMYKATTLCLDVCDGVLYSGMAANDALATPCLDLVGAK
jgi:WD40 repeat protein